MGKRFDEVIFERVCLGMLIIVIDHQRIATTFGPNFDESLVVARAIGYSNNDPNRFVFAITTHIEQAMS